MSDYTEDQGCDCRADPADALRAYIEGQPLDTCPVHRPAHMQPQGEILPSLPGATALNSDALTQTIISALGATDTGANL